MKRFYEFTEHFPQCIKCSKGVLPFLKRKHLINNSTYSVLLLVQQVTVPLENYNHHLHYSNFDL
jgi:hypothetical protein